MRKSITALFLFSIVALVVVKAKLQLIKNVNSTRYYSKGCSAHRSKTKVVVLQQEIKKDTVADKMGELILHKSCHASYYGQVSWKENCKWSTI
jgi:rare lipoprotein A